MILNKFPHNGLLKIDLWQSSRTDPFQTQRLTSFSVGLPQTACGFVSGMGVLDLAVFMLTSLWTGKLLIFHRRDLRWKLNSFVKLQLVLSGKEPCDQSRTQAPELWVRRVSMRFKEHRAIRRGIRPIVGSSWKETRLIRKEKKRKYSVMCLRGHKSR